MLLSGWAGSGKDTVADYLVTNNGFKRIAFGDFLKRDVAKQTGIPLELFYNRETKESLRELLLIHARKARALDKDVYAKQAVTEINELPSNQSVVISDWRYRRELEYLKGALGTDNVIRTVRVERPGLLTSADETEHDLDRFQFDHVLENTATVAVLHSKVARLVRCF